MDLFSGLKSFFKTNASIIDNSVFRLHYKVTSVILVSFSILVTARQYIGDPIDCSKDGTNLPDGMMDTYCWIHTTFSVSDSWHKKVGDEVAYPGVDKYVEGKTDRVFHAYYQWVCFVLFLQAILFYIPRYFWKAMEGGKIKNLVLGLNCPVLSEETKTTNRALLVEYLVSSLNSSESYFLYFTLAEIMNFANVVGQIYLMNTFLGGEFLSYGTDVIRFSEYDYSLRYDPMIKVFPRVTKCTFYDFGSGGSPQIKHPICVLPINIINEKIYIFLWFWFIILSVLSGLAVVYRILIAFCPRCRIFVCRSRARLVNEEYVESVCAKCNLSDWFLLDLLSKNLDPLNFRDVIRDLVLAIEERKGCHV